MTRKVLIIIGAGVTVLLGIVGYLAVRLNEATKENKALAEQVAYEIENLEDNKAQLEQEYVSLSNDLEGFSLKVDNDSILQKLNDEQKKVQLLLEELRVTKVTNSKRISELKRELLSVRKVLRFYVAQVDSLNKENASLKDENLVVNRKYKEASNLVDTLSQHNQVLNETVARAAQLDAFNIEVEPQTRKGKRTSRIRKTDILKVSFSIQKNITARVGLRTAYIRISNPNREVFFNRSSDTFHYENKDIVYSAKKDFEYSGKTISQVMYWTVTETLLKGAYRVDIFVDNHLIGTKDFVLR